MEESDQSVYYDNFVPKVAQGRNKSSEDVNAIGQGRVWTGTQAKANGLIDEFGGLEKAIEIAKQLANLPADKDVRRVVFPVPRPLFETISAVTTTRPISRPKRHRPSWPHLYPKKFVPPSNTRLFSIGWARATRC